MENITFFNCVLAAYFVLVIYGIFQGAGGNRSVIIFKDYDDLGLTFLIPASYVLITSIGGDHLIANILGVGTALTLLLKLSKNTYSNNEQCIKKTLIALLTKIPLSIIWILNFIQILNPSGRTASQRAQSRGQSMVVLAILTPILGLLVVNREGSLFNPKSWLAGRRVGNIRNHL